LSQRSKVLRPAPVKNSMYLRTSAFICSSMSSVAGWFRTAACGISAVARRHARAADQHGRRGGRVDQARHVLAGGIRHRFGGMQHPDRQQAHEGGRGQDGAEVTSQLRHRSSSGTCSMERACPDGLGS
jgi:hypothetical protein